jgi:hypothetical protein
VISFRPATPNLLKAIASHGLAAEYLGMRDGLEVLGALRRGATVEEIKVRWLGVKWRDVPPSEAQLRYMRNQKLSRYCTIVRNVREATLVLDAKLKPAKLHRFLARRIAKAQTADELTALARDVGLVKRVLPVRYVKPLVELGLNRRNELGKAEIPA